MKKVIAVVLLLILVFSLNGCAGKSLTYYGNLGYDLSETDHESIVFNVYHSNTADHTWELLKTLKCSPQHGHFADVRLEGAGNRIIVTSEDNYVEKTETQECYFTDDIDTYSFTVDGFLGYISGFETFDIKDIDEEQICRLYPISNDDTGVLFFEGLKIDGPYDEAGENLDNILITVRFE